MLEGKESWVLGGDSKVSIDLGQVEELVVGLRDTTSVRLDCLPLGHWGDRFLGSMHLIHSFLIEVGLVKLS